MVVNILFPHEEKARKKFLEEYEEIREKFKLPELKEVEETLRLSFPSMRKTTDLKVEDALLFMLRTAYDQLATIMARVLFPEDPIKAIESPLKDEKEKKEAKEILINLLLKYWEITRTLREKERERKIEEFKKHFLDYKRFDEYVGKIIDKIINKLKDEMSKIKEEKKTYFA